MDKGSLVFVFFCVGFVLAGAAKPKYPVIKPAQCSKGTFTREQAWVCALNMADANNDKKVSVQEIEDAEYRFIPTWKWVVMKAVSWFSETVRVSHIMKDCDKDHDGYISLDDFTAGEQTCLPYMDIRTDFRTAAPSLCLLKELCDHATDTLHRPMY